MIKAQITFDLFLAILATKFPNFLIVFLSVSSKPAFSHLLGGLSNAALPPTLPSAFPHDPKP
jgi:hypothetical protein